MAVSLWFELVFMHFAEIHAGSPVSRLLYLKAMCLIHFNQQGKRK